jgi:hypothetical protein
MHDSSLSARTVNKYVEYIKQVVKSLKAPNGEPVHKRTWDAETMDLPIVEHSEPHWFQMRLFCFQWPKMDAGLIRNVPETCASCTILHYLFKRGHFRLVRLKSDEKANKKPPISSQWFARPGDHDVRSCTCALTTLCINCVREVDDRRMINVHRLMGHESSKAWSK